MHRETRGRRILPSSVADPRGIRVVAHRGESALACAAGARNTRPVAAPYELVTIRAPDRATGYIADFALTRSVAFAVGGYDGRPTILSSSDGVRFVPLNPPDVSGLRSIW